jgi:bifunctional non-homologous end joining protein LigD
MYWSKFKPPPETSSLVKLVVFPPITIAKLARGLVPFDDPNWLFELKHDGFRSLAFIENNRCRLVSRHRNTYKSFETLADDLSRVRAKTAILDGEIVCLDSEGVSQFKELLYRRGRAVFFAFDLLWLDDSDLRRTPLIKRKKKLKQLIHRSECSEVIYAQHVEHWGKLLFEEVCERNLEGIVGKRKSSLYVEHGWVKIKNPNYSQAEGRHEMFTAFHEHRKKSAYR